MFDSFDPPWSDARDRGGQDELDREIYRDSRERGDDPRDALLNDLDLPRGHRRELVLYLTHVCVRNLYTDFGRRGFLTRGAAPSRQFNGVSAVPLQK